MMLFSKTDIAEKLKAIKQLDSEEKELFTLLKARQIHFAHKSEQHAISSGFTSENTFDFDQLETNHIYHLEQIRKICIDYRLRFLDLKYFKPSLPQSAHEAINQLEQTHQTRLTSFKIMAPSKLFKLENQDDPLLFVPLGNDYFYLVHKWGDDLHPFRKLLVWPFKSLPNLVGVLLVLSYFLTLLIPSGLFSKQDSTAEFWILYFFMFKMIASIVIFYGFALGKNFNPSIWNSKYFNA
jgi:hypothetical protein